MHWDLQVRSDVSADTLEKIEEHVSGMLKLPPEERVTMDQVLELSINGLPK